MFQPQVTTSPTAHQSRPQQYAVIIKGTPIKQVARQTIQVYCDLCDEQAHGTPDELRANRWGIYPKSAFCPFHEEMI